MDILGMTYSVLGTVQESLGWMHDRYEASGEMRLENREWM